MSEAAYRKALKFMFAPEGDVPAVAHKPPDELGAAAEAVPDERAAGEAVELGDDEAIRFEEAKRCVRIQQPAQKKTPRQVKKTEKGNA